MNWWLYLLRETSPVHDILPVWDSCFVRYTCFVATTGSWTARVFGKPCERGWCVRPGLSGVRSVGPYSYVMFCLCVYYIYIHIYIHNNIIHSIYGIYHWIGLRENLNRKPWLLPLNMGVSSRQVAWHLGRRRRGSRGQSPASEAPPWIHITISQF